VMHGAGDGLRGAPKGKPHPLKDNGAVPACRLNEIVQSTDGKEGE
jgi:hypothetical protein